MRAYFRFPFFQLHILEKQRIFIRDSILGDMNIRSRRDNAAHMAGRDVLAAEAYQDLLVLNSQILGYSLD